MNHRAGPGLAKVRTNLLTLRREKVLVVARAGPLLSWLEHADIVSEGALQEGAAARWFGSTSIRLSWEHATPGCRGPLALDAHALRGDPHLRIWALRIARREAELRACQSLGSARAEIVIEVTDRGLSLRVDLEAPLLRARRATLAT